MHRALRDALPDVWFSGFGAGESFLWHARTARGAPSPHVADLDGLSPLWLEQVDVRSPLRLAALPGAHLDAIRVVQHP